MANQFESAYDDLLAVYEAETGQHHLVTINGTPYRCIPTEIKRDDMLVYGGTGENGGWQVMVRKSLFGVAPVKMQTIALYGRTLNVLSFDDTNLATYTFVAEDPTIRT